MKVDSTVLWQCRRDRVAVAEIEKGRDNVMATSLTALCPSGKNCADLKSSEDLQPYGLINCGAGATIYRFTALPLWLRHFLPLNWSYTRIHTANIPRASPDIPSRQSSRSPSILETALLEVNLTNGAPFGYVHRMGSSANVV